ncbi:MAG: aldo/keto reductase [Clostridiales bacterium]|nr:aldo/keto reductase [Clostridiales bacterium]
MEYRTFKNTGEKISLLGFGTMRLPVVDGDEGKIDEKESIKMIRYAIDNGVNYVDTAYMYHQETSENLVAKALKDGYREKVYIADKMPLWLTKKAGGIEALFEEQFKRLDVDHIDFYLVHSLDKKGWEKAKEKELMPFLEKMKAEGRIGKIGFSFHDDLDTFKKIVDEYPWEFCQIQLNYMDADYQAGEEGLRYAGKKGLPVIIMEPFRGGKLIQSVPYSIMKLWDKAANKRSPAEWALKYLADFPEVLTILSGMSKMEEVVDNIRILSDAKPNTLTQEEKELIREVAREYNRLHKVPCTDCKYCLPCSQEIDIPTAIRLYNEWHLYKAYRALRRDFRLNMPEGKRPSDCTECRECEERCPQHLPIAEFMKETAEIFE